MPYGTFLRSLCYFGLFLLFHVLVVPQFSSNHGTVQTQIFVHAIHSRRQHVVMQRENRYDRSVTTFDPSGRLLQVEYGRTASERGGTIAAAIVNTTNHNSNNTSMLIVVIVAQTQPTITLSTTKYVGKTSSTVSMNKVHRLHRHVWMTSAGLAGDTLFLVKILRQFAQLFVLHNDVACTVEQIAKHATQFQHQLTHRAGRRPLGLTSFIWGWKHDWTNLPQLYRCSTGGVLEDCLYCAAGHAQEAVQSSIAKYYNELQNHCLSLSEAIEVLVCAVHEGLGYDQTMTEEAPKLDVWCMRKQEAFVDAFCLSGVVDAKSFEKIQDFLTTRDKEIRSEKQ